MHQDNNNSTVIQSSEKKSEDRCNNNNYTTGSSYDEQVTHICDGKEISSKRMNSVKWNVNSDETTTMKCKLTSITSSSSSNHQQVERYGNEEVENVKNRQNIKDYDNSYHDRNNDDNNTCDEKRNNNDDDDEDDDSSTIVDIATAKAAAEAVIYLQTQEERWEMTWPIWHMLPRHERKDIAIQYGYKTIGEFEEYMSFQQAFGDSSTSNRQIPSKTTNKKQTMDPSEEHQHQKQQQQQQVQQPMYPNELAYTRRNKIDSTTTGKNDVRKDENDDGYEEKNQDDVDDDNNKDKNNDGTDKKEVEMEQEQYIVSSMDSNLSPSELVKVGGTILMIPEEILHKIMGWLPVDMYATMAFVNTHWKFFTRTETVYKRLCERLYLQQSKRRSLHVSKFNNSYRTMLEIRPRIRACGGAYVMKYSQIKRIQRDMWTEIPHGAILESVYYRYLYFQEDGRVLYALTCAPPHEMFPRFKRVCLQGNRKTATNNNNNSNNTNSNNSSNNHNPDSAIVWGTYTVQKYKVTVNAKQPWQYVQLEMTICPEYKMYGRFGYLSFDKHLTTYSGDWDGCDCISFDVPDEPFRFVRDRRL